MTSNRPPDRGHRPDEPRLDPLLEVREKRKGQRLGDTYVRIVRPFDDEFEREEGRLVATERTVLERSGWTRTLRALRTVLIGRPISSDHEQHERLTKLKGVVEKPKPADAQSNLAVIGRYVLTPKVFEKLEQTQHGAGGEIQLTDAINALTAEQDVFAYAFAGQRYDAGTTMGWLKASIELALERPELSAEFRRYLAGLDLS